MVYKAEVHSKGKQFMTMTERWYISRPFFIFLHRG